VARTLTNGQWLNQGVKNITGVIRVELREFKRAELESVAGSGEHGRGQTVLITVALSIRDGEALWDAAAIKGLSAPGMRLSDLVDVIGPREDPALAECIAILAQPAPMPGCELEDFEVEIMPRDQFPIHPRDLKVA
jgi:hypothetical protein